MDKRYWLMKSEPETYSFDDLKREKVAGWDGVRNYQARNFMRDEMKTGDGVLFYHSSCAEPAIMGIAEVLKEGYPDKTAWDKKSEYFDAKSSKENPRWYQVDIKYKKEFDKPVTLSALKSNPKLKDMKVVQKGQRLSVQPVTKEEFAEVLKMA